MGNCYEGTLRFYLKKEISKDILHDLSVISERNDFNYSTETLEAIKDTKWGKHPGFSYPYYYLEEFREYYLFYIRFYMEGYMLEEDDLGQDIYDFLRPYIDESIYSSSIGGYIGFVQDGDGTYNKTFYVSYESYNKELNNRKYLCNKGCLFYIDGILCDNYYVCERAYNLGKTRS